MPKKTEVTKKNEMSKEELDALKEQLKKELLIEMKKDEAEQYKKKQLKKQQEEDAIKLASEKKDFKIPVKSKIDQFDRNITKKEESTVENITASSNIFLIIILLIVIGGVYFIPTIQKALTKKKSEPVASDNKKEVTVDSKEDFKWDSEAVTNIKFPIMRNNINSPETYYLNDSMTISSFSNNDILYNAFIDVYSGNMSFYEGGYSRAFCGGDGKNRELSAKYIDARVNNLFTKKASFTHEDFYVPLSSGSEFYGLWVYNPSSYSYIYYGECAPQGIAGELYYDVLVEDKIETSEDYKTAYLTYNIGFAKVLGDSYSIYRDPQYTDLLMSDTLKTSDTATELKASFKEFLKNHKVNKYKYTYSKKNCSYSDLCYISGEWVNE